MVVVTPGVDFIGLSLLIFGTPSVLFAFLLHTLNTTYNFNLPTWFLVSVSVLVIPFLFATKMEYVRLSNRRQASRLGARLAPRVDGKYPGNLDILSRLQQFWNIGYPADGFIDYIGGSKEPIANFCLLWSDLIFTTWPEHIKLILATDFGNYVKGERLRHALFPVLGSGVFNADGDLWKFHRSMTRPFFTRDRISDFELFDRHANTAIALIKERMSTSYAIDFQDLMSRFTLDSASEFLFGHCLHSLRAGIPYPHNASHIPTESSTPDSHRANNFAKAFQAAQEIITGRERFGWIWPLTEIFGDKTKEPMRIVNAHLEPIIQDAITKAAKFKGVPNESNVEEGETLIDHLVRLSSDPVLLRDETLNIMIAGRDTTASTLTFVMYLLSRYPAVLKRLRDEVLGKVGPSRRPDYDDIREMKYLRAVINETLRLFPTVPFNTRECVNATIWPSPDPTQRPIYIPAGTKVPYSVFLMHRRPDLWGPDAEEFDPDRFLDDRLKTYLIKNSFIFLPFNAGPRICLGQQFAYNEMSFMIIRLLQHFSSISLDEQATPPEARPPAHWATGVGRKATEKVWPKMHLTMYAYGGLWLKMVEDESL